MMVSARQSLHVHSGLAWVMRMLPALLALACSSGGADSAAPDVCDTPAAPASCVARTLDAQHYVDQSHAYFDTMDYEPYGTIEPDYAERVVRWEWPPWLRLTGFGAEEIKAVDAALVLFPSVGKERDCRAFDENPFGRCYVTFYYDDHEGRPCPIYEEFTFDSEGKITWIEAWTNLPGYLPMVASDTWAEGSENTRLSQRIPGLGNGEPLDIQSPALVEAAAADADVADFLDRAADWKKAWGELVSETDQDLMWAEGCGWVANGTSY